LIAKIRATLPVCLLVLSLAGCSANVTMEEPTIPPPRVAKIPVQVALRIPKEFENFIHEENVLGREAWTINLGRANATFFTQLFGYMFDGLTVIGPDDDARNFAFDALIEPSIDGFEFSVPNQSKTEAFAVWVRYRLRIFDREGNNAANWTVSAYGKSRKQGLRGSDSLRRAAVLAMRDAAALIILQMEKATGVSKLAGGALAEPSIEPAKMAAEPDVKPARDEAELDFGVFAIGGIDDE